MTKRARLNILQCEQCGKEFPGEGMKGYALDLFTCVDCLTDDQKFRLILEAIPAAAEFWSFERVGIPIYDNQVEGLQEFLKKAKWIND